MGSISTAQARSGDIAGAFKTVELITRAKNNYKISAQLRIARVQANSGDISNAIKTANDIQDPSYRSMAQSTIAIAQAKSGDISNAQKTIESAEKSLDLVDANSKDFTLSNIADFKAEAGDIVGAIKTANLVQDVYLKERAQKNIAIAQAQTGDIVGATKTTNLIQKGDVYGNWKKEIQKEISIAQAKVDITNGLKSVWLVMLDNNNMDMDCPLNTGPFLDLATYLKSLPTSDNPQKVFESFYKTVAKIVEAQNVIAGMQKQ